MKSISFSHTRFFLAALLLALCTSGFSQRTIVWKGGTPGKANDWNCARNWSTYTVPDEFSNVIVPDVSTTTFTTPTIESGRVAVNSIFIASNASLVLNESAHLVIFDGESSRIQNTPSLQGSIFFLDDSDKQAKSAVTASND